MTRIAFALVALLAAAWLALGLRSTLYENRGMDEFTAGLTLTRPTPAQARELSRSVRDLDRAAWLNPDHLPRAYYAQALVVLGQDARARAIIGDVTRAEPDNLQIWRVGRAMGIALSDRGLERQATRRVRELNPRPSR